MLPTDLQNFFIHKEFPKVYPIFLQIQHGYIITLIKHFSYNCGKTENNEKADGLQSMGLKIALFKDCVTLVPVRLHNLLVLLLCQDAFAFVWFHPRKSQPHLVSGHSFRDSMSAAWSFSYKVNQDSW